MSDTVEDRADGVEAGQTAAEKDAAAAERWERKRRRRIRRLLWKKIIKRTVASVVLILLLAVAALSQTREGQSLVLDTILERVRGALAGQLYVGGIRSGTLLTGATLTDVRLDAADGRPFLEADSVVLRYSIASVFTGASPVRSTTLWGVDAEISKLSEDDVLNVTRLLAPSPASSEAVAGTAEGDDENARIVQLGRVGIRGGAIRFLTPAAPNTTAPTVVGPDGQRLRSLGFEDLDLDLEDAVLRPGGAVALEAALASFSSSVFLVQRPLEVREAFGRLSFGEQGIRVQDAAFRMPSTLLRGNLIIGPVVDGAPWTFRSRLTVDGWGDLDDLQWVDPRIPDGRFRGSARIEVPREVELALDRLEVELEASNVMASGWVRFDEALTLRSMQVTASPLALERLEPWLDVDFPFEGWLSGEATFSGNLDDLSTTGRVTVVPTGYGGAPTTIDVRGVVHRGADPGATDLQLRLATLNYALLQSVQPDLGLTGTGRGLLELDGRAASGLSIVADFSHETDSASVSRATLNGTARRLDDGEWVADLRGELAPLSLDLFDRAAPELELRGDLAGPITLSGRMDDLRVGAELSVGTGLLAVDGSVDVRDPASFYRLEAEAELLPLAALSGRLPDRTAWSGRLTLQGGGLTLAEMTSRAVVVARGSRVGALAIDTLDASLRFERGVLVTDTLHAEIGGVEIDGRGRFGLVPGSWGASQVTFRGASVAGFRELVMGVPDTVLVRDGLGELDREFLRASGVDPDTLQSAVEVRMDGAVRGALHVSGELRTFDVGLLVDVVDGAYRRNEVDSARIALTATDLPGTSGAWGLGASARGIVFEGRSFQLGGFEAEMIEQNGSGRIEVVRTPDEQYRVAGSFSLADLASSIGLDAAQIQIGPDFWNLTRPTRVAWDRGSLTVDSLEIAREGDDPMALSARGTLARGGNSDFLVDIDGFHLDRIAHIGQIRDLQIGGHLDLEVAITGPAEAPVIRSDFRIDGPRYRTMELTRLDGSLRYRDQRAAFTLTGWDGIRDAIDASGELPLDLGLVSVPDRVLDRPMELTVAADSLDAAIALSYLTSLEQVIGVVSGEVTVGGTPAEPEPEGLITLRDAEWTVEALGVRHQDVGGSLTLNRDRTVDVALTAGGEGRSDVTGTIVLSPVTDPPLDLTFAFDRFPVVDRIDVEGLISGEFALRGTYRRPVATGELTVDESTVYVDEFRRVAGVVDLSDPLLFERGLGVDTTALVAQPLLAGLRNPFFDNLRVDIDLAVPRDTWLRSIETNVEMAGDLLVAYDRREGDLVLIGELEAVRGSHLVLNRTFELDGGTVSFIGRPGLNPDLDIQASARVRRRESDLDVLAHVGGTLIQPVVSLSTEEAGIGEADLVSYLIFGQPATDLGSSQAALFSQLDQNAAVANLERGLTWYSGALASQFAAAIAQGTGWLDYLSVRGGLSQFGRTQVEAGSYLGRDVFVVLVFQTTSDDADNENPVAGARVEWSLTDDYHIEGFWEDRFLRSGSAGFALPTLLDSNQVVGLFVFREWGY